MLLDASHIRVEDHTNSLGRAWADELAYGVIEVVDWDDAVERILDQVLTYDYGKMDMRVERGGKIILINVDTKERRIIECGC
jgi:hypothetical protein